MRKKRRREETKRIPAEKLSKYLEWRRMIEEEERFWNEERKRRRTLRGYGY